MSDSDQPSIPTWVPPGEHARPKPGSPEAQAEHERAHREGREPWSQPSGSAAGVQPGGTQGRGRSPAQKGQGQAKSAPAWPPAAGSGAPLRGAVDRGADEGDARTGGSAPHGTAAAASGPLTPTPQQRRLRAVVWVIVGVTAAGTMIYGAYLGFVWFLGWTATQIPRSWEVQIGRSAASDILSKARVCADPRLNRFIAKMAKRLEKGMKKKPYDFHFKVLDRKPVNAFALPGGYVFIHRGLLKKAESGSEVAGVLAHEIQHVLKRHGMRRVVRSLGFMLAVRIIFGDVGGFSDLVARGAVQLGSLKYDREQEDEADMEGVKLMYRAGIDPRGLPRFFSRLAKKEAKMSDTEKTLLPILSTHPPSAERRKRILRYIEKRGLPDKIKRFDTFKEVKNLCTPMQINDPDKMPSAKRKAEKSPEQRDAQSAQ